MQVGFAATFCRARLTQQALSLAIGFASFSTTATASAFTKESQTHLVVNSAEYRFPADIDSEVLPGKKTEIWARLYWQGPLTNKRPLLVFLHGNHGTCGSGQNPRIDSICDYTDSGTCPAGYQVTPNHDGYGYAADELAAKGYLVASINANLGITCGGGISGDWGLNLARGRLVLRHLEKLHRFHTGLEKTPASLSPDSTFLKGKIDFSQVGLMGHSRGGEGVRAAKAQFEDPGSVWPNRIPNLQIRAIYEIGAVDGQTDRELNALDTNWNQLLPMCDGDVSSLEGRMPYERMLKMTEYSGTNKSLKMVFGANHNFFNSEWQEDDSYLGCHEHEPLYRSGDYVSLGQQTVLRDSLSNFFSAHVGANSTPALAHTFDPQHPVSPVQSRVTRIEREFLPGLTSWLSMNVMVFDSTSQIAGVLGKGVDVAAEMNAQPNALKLTWHRGGSNVMAEIPWPATIASASIATMDLLDLRLQLPETLVKGAAAADFSIALIDQSGKVSQSIAASSFVELRGPGNSVKTYQTARIPLASFSGVDFAHLKTLRLIFDRSISGSVLLAGVRMSVADSFAKPILQTTESKYPILNAKEIGTLAASLTGTSFHPSHPQTLGRAAFDVRFETSHGFPITNTLPVLTIGEQSFWLSRLARSGQKLDIIFTIDQESFQKLPRGTMATIEMGRLRRWAVPDFRPVNSR